MDESASADDARRAHRRALLRAHPDQGGTRESFDRVMAAYATLVDHGFHGRASDVGRAYPAFARLRLVDEIGLVADVRGDVLQRRAVELHVMLGHFDTLAHGTLLLSRTTVLPHRAWVNMENARGESWREHVTVIAPAVLRRLAPHQWEEDHDGSRGE